MMKLLVDPSEIGTKAMNPRSLELSVNLEGNCNLPGRC